MSHLKSEWSKTKTYNTNLIKVMIKKSTAHLSQHIARFQFGNQLLTYLTRNQLITYIHVP